MSLPRTPQEINGVAESVGGNARDVASAVASVDIAKYRGIPEPKEDVKALLQSVVAIRENLEILMGLRGDKLQHAVKVGHMPALLGDDALLRAELLEIQTNIDSIIGAIAAGVSNDAYDAPLWDAVIAVAPSKDAVRDKFVAVDLAISNKEPSITVGDADNFWNGAKSFIAITISHVSGLAAALTSLSTAYVAKTAAYVTTVTDRTIDCTAGTFNVTLLTAVGNTALIQNIKNSGAGVITVLPDGAELIDSYTGYVLRGTPFHDSITVQSTGARWKII